MSNYNVVVDKLLNLEIKIQSNIYRKPTGKFINKSKNNFKRQ